MFIVAYEPCCVEALGLDCSCLQFDDWIHAVAFGFALVPNLRRISYTSSLSSSLGVLPTGSFGGSEF
jgi:hypothetical protein